MNRIRRLEDDNRTLALECIPQNTTSFGEPVIAWQVGVVATLLCVVTLVSWRRWCRTEFIMLFALCMVVSTRILTLDEALKGFSNPGIIAAGLMNIISTGMLATGGVDHFIIKFMGNPQHQGIALLRLMIPVAFASAFINNHAIVALLVPRIQSWSKRIQVPPTILMLPLSFASVLGGTSTIIGSSSNLALVGVARARLCEMPTIFQWFPFTLANVVLCIVFLAFLAPFLLPNAKEYERRRQIAELGRKRGRAILDRTTLTQLILRKLCLAGERTSPQEENELIEVENLAGEDGSKAERPASASHMKSLGYDRMSVGDSSTQADKSVATAPSHGSTTRTRVRSREYLWNAIVMNGSITVGCTVADAGLRGEAGLYLVSVQRGNTLYSAVGRAFEIAAGDLLSFTGDPTSFVTFCQRKGLQAILVDTEGEDEASSGEARAYDGRKLMASTVEVVVKDGSMLIGRTPKELDFRKRYNAAILSINRAGQRLKPQRMGRVELKVGDVLLCIMNEDFDWSNRDTARDLKPRHHPDQQKMIQLQDMLQENIHAERDDSMITGSSDKQFYISMKVAEMSRLGGIVGSLAGQTVEHAGLRSVPGVVLFGVQRIDREIGLNMTFRAIGPDFELKAGDVLWFSGERESIMALRRFPGLIDSDAKQLEKLKLAAHHRRLCEVVLSLRSDLLYKTVRESRFRRRFSAAIVAIHRQGAPILSTIGDVVLQPGDVLLLDAGPSFVHDFKDDPNFLLVAEVDGSSPPRLDKLFVALGFYILCIVLAVALEYFVDLILVFLWMCVVLLVTESLSAERVLKSVDWSAYLVMASAYSMELALQRTQISATIASLLIRITSSSILGVAVLISLLMGGLGSLLPPYAASVLMFPIALDSSILMSEQDSSVNQQNTAHLYILAIALGSSIQLRMFGSITNAMVYGPGGYVHLDYARFGLPFGLLQLGIHALIFSQYSNPVVLWCISGALIAASLTVSFSPRALEYFKREKN